MTYLDFVDRVKYIDSYIHHNNSVGVLVEFVCDTTIPGSQKTFKDYVQSVAMQIAATNPSDVDELLNQYSIEHPDKKNVEIASELNETLEEKIELLRFVRWDSALAPPHPEIDDPPPEASSAALRVVR